MKKIKYYFNTNTLRYEKFVTPLRVKLLRVFGFIAAALVTALILVSIAFRFIPSPEAKIATARYENMKENYDLLQLSDIGDRLVKSRLQSLSGVGQARIFGERRFSMRVWLSPSELSARGLTVQDVQQAIRTRNVEVPAGRIESERREFTVRSLGELKTPEEFGNLVVDNSNGILVKLKDLGRVELGAEDERSALRFKGTPAVAIGVVRQSKANILSVADEIRAEMPRIQASLPPGVVLRTAFDESVFVKRSIQEAEETLGIAALLVLIIIFIFLRTIWATVIPSVTIPLALWSVRMGAWVEDSSDWLRVPPSARAMPEVAGPASGTSGAFDLRVDHWTFGFGFGGDV